MKQRLSVNVITTPKWDLGQCVEAYAGAGVPAIGVIKATLQAYGRDKGIRKIEDAGLKVSSYAGIGPFTDPDDQKVKANVEAAMEHLDIAAELGADCVYVMSGPRGRYSWDEAADRFKEGLRMVLPAARERGVGLAVEPVHPMRQDLTFINTAVDAAGIADSLGDQPIGYVFDFYHLWWSRGVLETIRRSIHRIFAVQISDHKRLTIKTMDRAMIGEGIMPAAEIVRTLEEAGYKGYYDTEVISEDNERIGYEEVLRKTIEGWDQVWREAHA